MKIIRLKFCLLLAGLLCVMPVCGCASGGETTNSSEYESTVSDAQSRDNSAVSETPASETPASETPASETPASEGAVSEAPSSDRDISEESSSGEGSKTEESNVSGESAQYESVPKGRYTRNDHLKGSEAAHMNYEMELYPYNDRLYMRIISMSMRYDPEFEDLDGYDPDILRTRSVAAVTSVPFDSASDTFVFINGDEEITVRYIDRNELEVSTSDASYSDYFSGIYILHHAENRHPAHEAVLDPKTPDGCMDAGMAEAVRAQLGIAADAEITKEDCAGITKLYLSPQNRPIVSLDGIGCFTSLKNLSVYDSEVRDISALGALTELESISFTNSMIEEIPDLSTCKKLKKVEFVCDYIRDISPLNKIQELESVILIEDLIPSIAPLKDNHTIRSLTLNNNCIRDWESINDNEDLKKALMFDYKYYLEIQRKSEEILRATISDDMSDLEKQIRLAKYIEDFIGYDYVQEDPDQSVPSGYYGIIENVGVCENYARSAKYLMNMAGLEVICTDSGDHEWNMIKLDGKWYEFDCTWDDEKEIGEWSWFNVSTDSVSRNNSHWTFLPERVPYAAEDMPFTEYCRYGKLPD